MKHLSALLICFFILASCGKKEDPEPVVVPPANYLKCNVNGSPWKAGCTGYMSNCIDDAYWSYSKKYLTINVNNSSQTIGLALFDTVNGIKSGTYILGGDQKSQGDFLDFNKSSRYGYTTNAGHTGTVVIELDSAKGRVSGTFSFKAQYSQSAEVVEVTSGQFSLRCIVN